MNNDVQGVPNITATLYCICANMKHALTQMQSRFAVMYETLSSFLRREQYFALEDDIGSRAKRLKNVSRTVRSVTKRGKVTDNKEERLGFS